MGGGQALLAAFNGSLREIKSTWKAMVGKEWGIDLL